MANPEKNRLLIETKERAEFLYKKQSEIYCPYFGMKIILNSDGFNHLQHKPNRKVRDINVQITKLTLLKKALDIIPKAGTLQEYRSRLEKIGKKQANGFYKTKTVQYWGFNALIDENKFNIRFIIKQIGDGKHIFWSVMPVNKGTYSLGIEED